MIPTLDDILKTAKIHPLKVKGCYIFGSQVYGTAKRDSDWDIILVANNSVNEQEIKHPIYNIHIITPDHFQKLATDNHIKIIECLFAPQWAILKEFPLNFKYKEPSFRHNVSHSVSNSWVKAKKKLEVGETYIGIKSLYHSLRMVTFAIQFAETKCIDFHSTIDLWKDIISTEPNWEVLKDKFQPLRNELLTKFRLSATK